MDHLCSLLLDLEAVRFFGIKLINYQDFGQLVARFIFNFGVTLVLVRFIYYPVSRRKDYLFSYLLFGSAIFLLCHILLSAGDKLNFEFALGLFAIFSIIRYRTNPIPIKEMTYLFVLTGIAVINSLAVKKISYAEMAFANLSLLGLMFLLERIYWVRREVRKNILYEKIELILPEKREELLADLKLRTGLDIHRIEIGNIDFLRDTVKISVFYKAEKTQALWNDDSAER
ncbi:MAG: DUF4956 domain-containing protein [Salibacteraceae bacterium]